MITEQEFINATGRFPEMDDFEPTHIQTPWYVNDGGKTFCGIPCAYDGGFGILTLTPERFQMPLDQSEPVVGATFKYQATCEECRTLFDAFDAEKAMRERKPSNPPSHGWPLKYVFGRGIPE